MKILLTPDERLAAEQLVRDQQVAKIRRLLCSPSARQTLAALASRDEPADAATVAAQTSYLIGAVRKSLDRAARVGYVRRERFDQGQAYGYTLLPDGARFVERLLAGAGPHVCPVCSVERADFEGPGEYLDRCPNCGSDHDPVPA